MLIRMASRPLMIATLLGASVGVPYVVSNQSTLLKGAGAGSAHPPATQGSAWPATQGATVTGMRGMAPAAQSSTGPQPLMPAPHLEGVRLHPVESVLRFDLTRDWVYQNW